MAKSPHEETSGRTDFRKRKKDGHLKLKRIASSLLSAVLTSATSLMGQNVITKLNQPKVRTMSRNQLWKPLCGLLVLLFTPLTGRSDVVQDWDAIMQATVSSQPPFPQAGFAAITQLAVFEAVNAITREYKPYLGTITAPHDASPEAAAAMIAARANDGSSPLEYLLPTSSNPGVWQLTPIIFDDAARQITTATPRSLSENARAFALINMAISDAAVATFYNKYLYKFWRPETAIHDAGDDGNDKTTPDANFKPLIETPCFPSYPSVHGTLSNAAREVMEKIYGEGPFSITLSTPALPGVTLHYSRLEEITDDISDARVYGGIHFRTDQDAGALLETRIGEYIYNHKLRSEHGADCDDQFLRGNEW
jgi:hypothetical protein